MIQYVVIFFNRLEKVDPADKPRDVGEWYWALYLIPTSITTAAATAISRAGSATRIAVAISQQGSGACQDHSQYYFFHCLSFLS
jgi:hypothetical protein